MATCVETGKAVYFEKDQPGLDFKQAVKASASLPLASVPVKIDGHSYLDGGCACPIPINWALRQGFAKIVIVATREKGFRKKQPSQRMVDLYDDFYGDKPLFLATLLTQEMRYNALLDQIDALEDEGRICVIRPDEPVGIGRFEGSTEKPDGTLHPRLQGNAAKIGRYDGVFGKIVTTPLLQPERVK